MEGLRIANICPMNEETSEYLKTYGQSQGIAIETISFTGSTRDELTKTLSGFDAVIAGGAERYTGEVFQSLRKTLKAVCRFGAGYDNIDAEAARDNGIAVMIAGGGNSAAVADHAIMLMLSLGRHICIYDREMRQEIWSAPRVSVQLEGKTIGIIGFGRVGRILSQYLSGFGCLILAMDSYVGDAVMKKCGVHRADMDEIARKSDYISLHAPYTPQTRDMINSEFLQKMKPTAYIINTSRGGLINENDLIEALRNGNIAGAALDVFQNEPLGSSPLLSMDNVILSPHVAYNTREANLLTARVTVDNLSSYLKTGVCEDIVNG